MFELLKRLGKFIRYGLHSLIVVIVIAHLLFDRLYANEILFSLFTGLLFISFVEVLARTAVWIVSGYFESKPKTKISQKNLNSMREYYTYRRLRNKFLEVIKE